MRPLPSAPAFFPSFHPTPVYLKPHTATGNRTQTLLIDNSASGLLASSVMVARSGDGSEGQRPLTPSRTPGTPMKPRLSRVGTSPSKREDKTRDDKVSKSSAKDVAELKDYVRTKPFPGVSGANADLLILSNSNWATVWGRERLDRSIAR